MNFVKSLLLMMRRYEVIYASLRPTAFRAEKLLHRDNHLVEK